MSDNPSSDGMPPGFTTVFEQISAYIETLIVRQVSPFQLARRLNGELPAQLDDTRRSLIALLDERLAKRGEEAASSMSAQARIRYYKERIDGKLASECHLPVWTPWRPALSEWTRKTGVVLTGAFGLSAVVGALSAVGISSIKLSLCATSPYSTSIMFAMLAILAGVAAVHPEKIPGVMGRERKKAREHLATYLRDAEAAFVAFVREAELALDKYVKTLGTNSTSYE